MKARAKACALLGVQADDLNVSCEVLEMPQKTGFLGLKLTPAKVCVSVEEPDAPLQHPLSLLLRKRLPCRRLSRPLPCRGACCCGSTAGSKGRRACCPRCRSCCRAARCEEEEPEVPIVIEENAKIKAAVDYLREVIALMGVENVTFSAVQKGEATIIRLDGEKLGASSAAAARPWRAFPIWQALWQTVWRAITSSWVWMWPATATSARAT